MVFPTIWNTLEFIRHTLILWFLILKNNVINYYALIASLPSMISFATWYTMTQSNGWNNGSLPLTTFWLPSTQILLVCSAFQSLKWKSKLDSGGSLSGAILASVSECLFQKDSCNNAYMWFPLPRMFLFSLLMENFNLCVGSWQHVVFVQNVLMEWMTMNEWMAPSSLPQVISPFHLAWNLLMYIFFLAVIKYLVKTT